MRNLQSYMDANNVPYTDDPESGDGIFFPITFDHRVVEQFRQSGRPVIQRLDGVYYADKHGWRYRRLNRPMKKTYLRFATDVVFQSDYSRRQVHHMFGTGEGLRTSCVRNGADPAIYFPDRQRTPDSSFQLVTTGRFRNPDMIVPIVTALDLLTAEFSFELTVVGPFLDQSLQDSVRRDWIRFAGPMDLPRVAETLRQSDIYLFSFLNPPCPNAVIEAAATGLPVVSFDTGSMAELVPHGTGLLAPMPDRLLHRPGDLSPDLLAEKIRACLHEYPRYRQLALDQVGEYTMDTCAAGYVKAFRQALDGNVR